MWYLIKPAVSVGAQLFVLIVIAGYAWTTIHEFSHLIAAKITCGVHEWTMKVWPCKLDGVKVGGYVQYHPIREQTDYGKAFISLAPFIVSTLACIVLPIAVASHSLIFIAIAFAGVSDQVGGAFVKSDTFWDLPNAAEKLNIPLWRMRLYILVVPIISCAISFRIYIDILRDAFIAGWLRGRSGALLTRRSWVRSPPPQPLNFY